MRHLGELLSDDDLRFLVQAVSPGTSDRERMVRVLRQDDDILEGMLRDDRLLRRFLEEPERVVSISPALFFAGLLAHVATELERSPYTIEQEVGRAGRFMLVFDSREVLELLNQEELAAYLVELLMSFVRIRSYSVVTRMRPGVWKRFHFDEFDVDAMVELSQAVAPAQRFPLYKRIADVCLFASGFFPRTARVAGVHARGGTLDEYGRQYYREAAGRPEARRLGMDGVLETLADSFSLAAKPLELMATRYVGHLTERLFTG